MSCRKMDTIVTVEDTKYVHITILNVPNFEFGSINQFFHLQPKIDALAHASSPHDAIEAKLQRAIERHAQPGYDHNANQHKKFLSDLLDMLKQHEVIFIEENLNNF